MQPAAPQQPEVGAVQQAEESIVDRPFGLQEEPASSETQAQVSPRGRSAEASLEGGFLGYSHFRAGLHAICRSATAAEDPHNDCKAPLHHTHCILGWYSDLQQDQRKLPACGLLCAPRKTRQTYYTVCCKYLALLPFQKSRLNLMIYFTDLYSCADGRTAQEFGGPSSQVNTQHISLVSTFP